MKLRQPDKHIFRNMTKFQDPHRDALLRHMKDLMIRIKGGSITVEETRDRFDNFQAQCTTLLKHYKK